MGEGAQSITNNSKGAKYANGPCSRRGTEELLAVPHITLAGLLLRRPRGVEEPKEGLPERGGIPEKANHHIAKAAAAPRQEESAESIRTPIYGASESLINLIIRSTRRRFGCFI